ncbi:MAG: LacI family DNA-binding transcriptional regulator [Devosia sp.]
MIGIRRLAEHLGLSIGTVSRALNNRPDVNPETRKRVLEAADELGYVPNQSGQSLRKGTTNSIGFMIQSGFDPSSNSDNFFLGVFDGVQIVLRRHNLDLTVLPCPLDEDPAQYLQRMVARRGVDAMIISATRRVDARIDMLIKARMPFIALGRSTSGSNYPWIDLDFEGVANVAIDRLVARGHRRIALGLPSNDINLGYVFLDGYKSALKRHKLSFDPSLVARVATSEQGGYQLTHQILAMQPRPSAVLLVYEMMAIGAYRRLNEAGLLPGKDLAIVTFREPPMARFLSPSLTCFRMSLRDFGVSLGESLLAAMPDFASTYPNGIVNKIWPLELVSGESDPFMPK